MRKKINTKGRVGKVKRRTRPYPYEFRIKMVQLYLKEGYSTTQQHSSELLRDPDKWMPWNYQQSIGHDDD